MEIGGPRIVTVRVAKRGSIEVPGSSSERAIGCARGEDGILYLLRTDLVAHLSETSGRGWDHWIGFLSACTHVRALTNGRTYFIMIDASKFLDTFSSPNSVTGCTGEIDRNTSLLNAIRCRMKGDE